MPVAPTVPVSVPVTCFGFVGLGGWGVFPVGGAVDVDGGFGGGYLVAGGALDCDREGRVYGSYRRVDEVEVGAGVQEGA
jgi:hypothetical protein